MTLHQAHLVAFAAGSVIHGTQSGLVLRLRREAPAGRDINEGVAICLLAFFWQFGNLWRELALTFHYSENSAIYNVGDATRALALIGFPLLFSYSICGIPTESRLARALIRAGGWLRYPLLIFVPISTISIIATYLQKTPIINPGRAESITLYTMLVYFALFAVVGWINSRLVAASGKPRVIRANRAGTIAAFVAFSLFMIMLAGGIGQNARWIELAAMMTSVPFTIAIAYQFYQFPFMDGFLRAVMTDIIMLVIFCIGFSFGFRSSDMLPLWTAALALTLAFAKEPISRWVDRHLLGYNESVEQQEERIGNAIRALSRLSEFGPRVSEILKIELEADWVSIAENSRSDAVNEFLIPGSPSLWLSLGPRRGARSYMSRQLQLAKRAVLELTAQRHLLREHELRESTARAQMQALQAQINPHFLFNTLNVLSNLIHTNPAKAEHVTEDLAEVFRYALDSTRLEWVRMEDELRFLQSYLEIEQTRFENRLSFQFDIEPPLRSLRIPPMILQPLVENAVRHGISRKREGGNVRVTARCDADGVIVVVEDTGTGIANAAAPDDKGARGSGIGLANVRQRLTHVYNDLASIQLEQTPTGTRVLLKLPQRLEVHA